MLDDKDSFVFSILVVGYIYIIRIQIVKVYFFAALFTYARGEHYVGSWFLHAVDEGADALNVGRVGHHAAGSVGKLVHLLEKVVARVVADLVQVLAVRV